MWPFDYRRELVLALLLLSGCGWPTSEPPADARAAGSVAVGTTTTGVVARGPTVVPSATPLADHHVPASTLRPPIDHQPSPQEPNTDVSNQAAWTQWYEAARESPDVSVRLQALETWAHRPGDSLDPVTYGLVDEDDTVRARAQTLYEQQLVREATAAAPSEPEAKDP